MKILSYASESFEPLIPVALIIARAYILFVALAGEIFGQMFFGHFSLISTIIGISAIFAGVFGGLRSRNNYSIGLFVMSCCIAALGGTLAKVIHYYAEYNTPGNDFAWEFRAPFILSLIFIAFFASPHKITSKQVNN